MCQSQRYQFRSVIHPHLQRISRQAGLSSSTLANVLSWPWPKGEFLLAGALGIHPSEIWPSRYFDAAGNLIDRQKQIRRKLE
ncbi:helix-turn-helix domain-containing protein [Candidatus Symbiopectobacterium sp. NZEC135]|uniref:helix-turn-helix domain-containing protein n=1 Tax=Candidatus Symbiopectobacterium sp. NZEC135 TaxID=2820471 RepID=UPI0039B62D37